MFWGGYDPPPPPEGLHDGAVRSSPPRCNKLRPDEDRFAPVTVGRCSSFDKPGGEPAVVKPATPPPGPPGEPAEAGRRLKFEKAEWLSASVEGSREKTAGRVRRLSNSMPASSGMQSDQSLPPPIVRWRVSTAGPSHKHTCTLCGGAACWACACASVRSSSQSVPLVGRGAQTQ